MLAEGLDPHEERQKKINLENNIKLRNYFDDYRFKKEKVISDRKSENYFLKLIQKKVAKRSYLYRVYENNLIKKYLKIIDK